jgi:hypothetical protein
VEVATVPELVKAVRVTLVNVQKSDNILNSSNAIVVDQGNANIQGLAGSADRFQIETDADNASFVISNIVGDDIYLTANTLTT